ncbi:MFS transporter [Actinomadura opuntiae]|uniref:MFS transporter n=1 Tax=Actinomadura sp. OS1-43 TaxID=604315 RepID=UPI00255ABEE0|nr:MFS transporter [Actinomadura sp. OS1-43]MDL4820409.1 MFS transporter [Actinomadura sp. OS1-43]
MTMSTAPTAPPPSARYRDVFGVPEFRTLFGVQTLLVTGESIRMIALSVLVFERTGSTLFAALAFSAGMLPYVVGGMFLLSLADRVPPRRLLTGYFLARCAVDGVLALGGLPVPGMLALVAGIGVFAPVGSASLGGRLPGLLSGDRYVLGRSVFTMTMAVAQIAGQAVGGLLLAVLAPSGTLLLAAASGGTAAALAWCGLKAPQPQADGDSSRFSGTVRETWQVNRRLLTDRRVRGLLLAWWLPVSLAVGSEAMAVPYGSGLGRPGAAGLLLASSATGMFAGNLVLGRWVRPSVRERLTLPLALLTGAPLVAFVFGPGLAAACALMAAGAFGMGYDLNVQARVADVVPDRIQGQAVGLATMGIVTGQAAAMAGAGALGGLLAPGYVIAVCGVGSLVGCLVVVRRLRGRFVAAERGGP